MTAAVPVDALLETTDTATAHTRTVTLGSHRTVLKPGATLRPSLKVSRTKLAHLVKHGRVKVRIRVTIGRRGSRAQTDTVQLTVRIR